MPKDTMTSEQRLRTVIGLDVPDRVPVAPMIYHFAARYARVTMHDLWSDPAKYSIAAGCEIPPNARPGNVKAMIDAATQFGYYC
jgi:hypothetical protein